MDKIGQVYNYEPEQSYIKLKINSWTITFKKKTMFRENVYVIFHILIMEPPVLQASFMNTSWIFIPFEL